MKKNLMKNAMIRASAAFITAPALIVGASASTSPSPSPTPSAGEVASNGFANTVKPIVELLNSLMGPLLAIVAAVGALYCILLGVKFAKAEEPQDREKAKGNLKNAIIGFVLIFVLLVVLNLLLPVMKEWVNSASNVKVF